MMRPTHCRSTRHDPRRAGGWPQSQSRIARAITPGHVPISCRSSSITTLSSYCMKALIALYENEVRFTPKLVDLSDPAQRAALVQIWPMGKFPVLRDEASDRTIPEDLGRLMERPRSPGRSHRPGPTSPCSRASVRPRGRPPEARRAHARDRRCQGATGSDSGVGLSPVLPAAIAPWRRSTLNALPSQVTVNAVKPTSRSRTRP